MDLLMGFGCTMSGKEAGDTAPSSPLILFSMS